MKEPASVSMVFSVALLFPVPALVCITIMTLSLLVQALVWIWPSLWIFFFLRQDLTVYSSSCPGTHVPLLTT